MSKVYPTIKSGEVVTLNPEKNRLFMSCCDCGLTHSLVFGIESKKKLHIRIVLEKRSTGQIRRHWNKAISRLI